MRPRLRDVDRQNEHRHQQERDVNRSLHLGAQPSRTQVSVQVTAEKKRLEEEQARIPDGRTATE